MTNSPGSYYAYSGGNPVMAVNPSGYWVETALDVSGLCWSAYDFYKDPSWANAGWMALDVVCIVAPVVTGSYALKAASKADNVIDVLFRQ